jgi:anti-sigma factor RsiW
MNRTALQQKLMPYADGELPAAERAEVEQALREHPELQAELDELRRVSLFAREAVLAPAASVDLSGVFDGVMARLAKEAPAEPSVFERLSRWFASVLRFERPMVLVAMGAAGAAILAVVIGLSLGSGAGPVPAQDTVAKQTEQSPRRRGPEAELKMLSRGDVRVEKLEAEFGKTRISFDENDPETPMVLWHEVEGEGVAPPRGL